MLVTNIERYVLDGSGKLTPEKSWLPAIDHKWNHNTTGATPHAVRIHVIGEYMDFWVNEDDTVAVVIPA